MHNSHNFNRWIQFFVLKYNSRFLRKSGITIYLCIFICSLYQSFINVRLLLIKIIKRRGRKNQTLKSDTANHLKPQYWINLKRLLRYISNGKRVIFWCEKYYIKVILQLVLKVLPLCVTKNYLVNKPLLLFHDLFFTSY